LHVGYSSTKYLNECLCKGASGSLDCLKAWLKTEFNFSPLQSETGLTLKHKLRCKMMHKKNLRS